MILKPHQSALTETKRFCFCTPKGINKLATVLYIIIATALTPNISSAQAPQKMSYQAVVRNASNALVANATVGTRISILQTSASGTAVYVETQTPSTNANGLISLEIGSGTVVSGIFANINWASGSYFIKTEIDPTGGTNYTISGTSQMLSVPYALYAETGGTQGPQGPIGLTGATGATGPQGLTGPQGPPGGGNGFSHYVGELFEGGIIVKVWKVSGVEHGLIASKENLTSTLWSDVSTTFAGTTTSRINGLANTTAIMGQTGHTNSAALVCYNYSKDGYTDWYLPTIWELKWCYEAAFIVNEVLGNTNGFIGETYWTSNELSATEGNDVRFGFHTAGRALNGQGSQSTKGTARRVRAVREF